MSNASKFLSSVNDLANSKGFAFGYKVDESHEIPMFGKFDLYWCGTRDKTILKYPESMPCPSFVDLEGVLDYLESRQFPPKKKGTLRYRLSIK